MDIGMLWFDNSSDQLKDKLQKAANYFERKYGKRPTLCFVNDSMFGCKDVEQVVIVNIKIRPSECIGPNHMWLGFEKEQEQDVYNRGNHDVSKFRLT